MDISSLTKFVHDSRIDEGKVMAFVRAGLQLNDVHYGGPSKEAPAPLAYRNKALAIASENVGYEGHAIDMATAQLIEQTERHPNYPRWQAAQADRAKKEAERVAAEKLAAERAALDADMFFEIDPPAIPPKP